LWGAGPRQAGGRVVPSFGRNYKTSDGTDAGPPFFLNLNACLSSTLGHPRPEIRGRGTAPAQVLRLELLGHLFRERLPTSPPSPAPSSEAMGMAARRYLVLVFVG